MTGLPERTRWRKRNATLDPEVDHVEIYRTLTLYEFPWDFNQALSLALFRTYAVPSIGALLHRTRQFEEHGQQRYDDTALLLEAPLVHGFDSRAGRDGVRRINQMHRMYDISNDDMRYVLATFVVVPQRWLNAYGWRRLTEGELRAVVNYYRELGHHLGIHDIPVTYDQFMHLMDDYERAHFAHDEGGRKVADATLALLADFYPRPVRRVVEVASRALMDGPLLTAFGYDDPGTTARRLTTAALRARARVLRHTPSRRSPSYVIDSPRVRTHRPGEFRLSDLGTFPAPTARCPARAPDRPAAGEVRNVR